MLSDMDLKALRLRPDDDLRASLLAYCTEQNVEAAFVLTCTGSLKQAVIRFADAPGGTVLEQPLEILTLSGTLSRHGAHLHITVADAHGHVLGGHLLEGSMIYTTAELVLGFVPDTEFRRKHDPATGYTELEL